MVTEHPCLPLAYLRELRLELDACLSLLRDDCRRAVGAQHETAPTPSPPIGPLCAQDPPAPTAASKRSKLLPLVSALLSEALDVLAMTEAGDEDHR